MNFIFPMGGLSSRFANAGYTLPKFQLDLYEKTVFEHAVIGFSRFFSDHTFVFAFRGGSEIAGFVTEKCLGLGIPEANLKLVCLNKVTSGQAETVRIAIDEAGIDEDAPITIFNIDTFQIDYVLPNIFNPDEIDGYLEVFIAEGEHWSFVEPGADNSVIRVTEKERISEYCSSGLYYFRKAKDFCKAFDKALSVSVEDLSGGERYVAPLYNDIIAAGGDIRYNLVGLDQLTFCGTPAEYEHLLKAQKPESMRQNLGQNKKRPPSEGAT